MAFCLNSAGYARLLLKTGGCREYDNRYICMLGYLD